MGKVHYVQNATIIADVKGIVAKQLLEDQRNGLPAPSSVGRDSTLWNDWPVELLDAWLAVSYVAVLKDDDMEIVFGLVSGPIDLVPLAWPIIPGLTVEKIGSSGTVQFHWRHDRVVFSCSHGFRGPKADENERCFDSIVSEYFGSRGFGVEYM